MTNVWDDSCAKRITYSKDAVAVFEQIHWSKNKSLWEVMVMAVQCRWRESGWTFFDFHLGSFSGNCVRICGEHVSWNKYFQEVLFTLQGSEHTIELVTKHKLVCQLLLFQTHLTSTVDSRRSTQKLTISHFMSAFGEFHWEAWVFENFSTKQTMLRTCVLLEFCLGAEHTLLSCIDVMNFLHSELQQ